MFKKMGQMILIGLGHACFIVGLVGIFIPLLPTTPFILLASACYTKGSERFHYMILNNRYCGPIIKNWQNNKSISLKSKLIAIAMLIGSLIYIFVVLSSLLLKGVVVVFIFLVGLYIVSRSSSKGASKL